MDDRRTAIPRPVPILRYRAVDPGVTNPELGIDAALFGDHLDALLTAGYLPLTIDDLVTAITLDAPLPKRPVLITFDHGLTSFHEYALPALRVRDFPATVFVTTAFVGRTSRAMQDAAPEHRVQMSWSQLRELSDEDVAVGSNGHSHRPLDVMNRWEAGEDLALSRSLLEHQLNRDVVTVAYPAGLFGSGTKSAAARIGMVAGCTLRGLMSSNYDDPYALSRISVHGQITPEVLVARLTLASRQMPTRGESLRERMQRTARRVTALGAVDTVDTWSGEPGAWKPGQSHRRID